MAVAGGRRAAGAPARPPPAGARRRRRGGRGDAADAALLAVHHLVGGACTAAVRLLGLDPLAVAAVAAEAGRHAEPVVADAAQSGVAAAAAGDPDLLPADGNPLFDVLAQLHRSTEATLFAS